MQLDVHPFTDVDAARAWAADLIDASAGAARARYITVTAGQDATYQAKYADAQAFARAGYPENQLSLYPWVAKEAEAIGDTGKAAADEIRENGDPWNAVIGPNIEGLRIGGKRALKGMATISEVVSHARSVQQQLEAA